MGNEDDLSIDFSWMKKIFNSKNAGLIITILLILIPIALSTYIRLQPQYMPATDEWAKNSVENYYRNSIVQQVNAQYPNLPAAQKNTIVNQQWNEFHKTNKAQISEQTKQTSSYFKTGFQYEENGNIHTFLGDLDSYFYLRQAKNIDEKGAVCDKIVDGKCIDDHMVAPETRDAEPSMHPYGTFYLYKVLNFINPKINLMDAAFYLPTLIAAIGVLAAFFIGRKLMNEVGGFFAAMFFAIHPMLVTRTLGSDTDIWNIVFPLVIIWIFLEAFETKKFANKIIFSTITGLAMASFAFAWGGWWYIFYFILAALIGHILFLLLKNFIRHKSIKNIFTKEIADDSIILGALVASTGIFVSLIYSFGYFLSSLSAPFVFSETLKKASAADLWPNVLTTVAELNEANLQTVIGQASFGLYWLFALSLLGIIFLIVKKNPDFKDYMLIIGAAILYLLMISPKATIMDYKWYLIIIMLPVIIGLWIRLYKHSEQHQEHDIKPALIMVVWFIGMIFTSTRGVRFILLLAPVFCIAIGITLGYLYQYLNRIMHEKVKINITISRIGVFIILALILIMPVDAGIKSGKSYMPSITKGWWDSLTKIRMESSQDTIINSWWDFGHWFKYVADRRVTFDGASQLGPLAHWTGRSLQTNMEKETIGILRMLACGSNKAFEEINKKYADTEKSQNIVAQIILMDRDAASLKLSELGFTEIEKQNILQYSHCNPPEMYYITSEDMVSKAGVWAHFGLWDIDRAFIINDVRPKPLSEAITILKNRFNYTDEEAARVYYEVQALRSDREMNDWISPWPGYAGGIVNCPSKGELVQCSFNIMVSNNGQIAYAIDRVLINMSQPENMQIIIAAYDQATGRKMQENPGAFETMAILNDTLREYKANNATLGLGMILNVNGKDNETSYQAIIANPQLISSTFTRLFFFDGKGMKHFEKFSDVTDITGTRIIVWKVKWSAEKATELNAAPLGQDLNETSSK